MKSQHCKKRIIYDIDYIHEKTVANTKTRDIIEQCLLDALLFNETKREILFPYNFE